MPKKITIGMLGFFIGVLAVFIIIKVAASGFKFGQYLAQATAQDSRASSSSSD
jgi:hypothetical protein